MDRILIADDQIDVLESLRLLLKNEGFTIESVTSPRAVLDALESHQFDVLLLDMNYARDTTSGGEGLELLAQVHRINDALPVVLMTAWSSVGLAVEAMRRGGFDFVEKPWNNTRLLETLRRNIEEGRAKQARKRLEEASTEAIRDLEEARQTQQRLLPATMPQIPGIDIKSSWVPARNIGGDYFDAIRLDDTRLAFCIGDVAGKGLPAALVMSNIQAAVRAYSQTTPAPAQMCKRLNRMVSENTLSTRFVSFFYGVLDMSHRSLIYTNAGHVPPVLTRKGGHQEILSEGGIVLGPFFEATYQQASVALHPGDSLALLTDGITEAANRDGEQFGENGRIMDLLFRNRGLTSEQLRDTLLDAVASFSTQDLEDDATVMVLSLL